MLTGKVLVYLELPFEHTGKPARPDNLELARELGTSLWNQFTCYLKIPPRSLRKYCNEKIAESKTWFPFVVQIRLV